MRAPGRNSLTYRVSSAIHGVELVAIADPIVSRAKAVRRAVRNSERPFVARRADRARRHRPHRRLHAERDALRSCVGGAAGGQARAVRKAGRLRLSRHAARQRAGERERLKTKLGFTFRYSPAMQYMKTLIDDGFVGTPFIFNGYEQNSQWLDPHTPLRQVDHEADQSVHPGLVARRLRRADHGPRTSAAWAAASRRWSAR